MLFEKGKGGKRRWRFVTAALKEGFQEEETLSLLQEKRKGGRESLSFGHGGKRSEKRKGRSLFSGGGKGGRGKKEIYNICITEGEEKHAGIQLLSLGRKGGECLISGQKKGRLVCFILKSRGFCPRERLPFGKEGTIS